MVAMDIARLGRGHGPMLAAHAPRTTRPHATIEGMPIDWDPDARQWHLRNDHMSVILAVRESGALGQLYLGGTLTAGRDYRHLGRGEFHGWSNRLGESIRLEVPTPDTGDYRHPALGVRFADGSSAIDLRYARHRIEPGKPALPGLPSTYVEDPGEADTLEMDLTDARSGLVATVRLTLFRDHAALARSVTVRNDGSEPVTLRTDHVRVARPAAMRAGSASRSTAPGRANAT